MPPPIKLQLLADWHSMLDDRDGWKNQSSRYSCLMKSADYMLSIGVIDPLERFELVELLTGAYCHYTEEFPPEWRHPASDYAVYNRAGVQVGSLSGNRYFFHGKGVKPGAMDFMAQIHEKDGEQKIITRVNSLYGVLRERYIYTETGQRLILVETTRRFGDWDVRTRLDDPDAYRALLDASLVALEQGDIPLFVALREKELFSVFTQCLKCCDRFDLREDCQDCGGRGFLEDPDCPNNLPPSLRNATHE